jgi:hypothetical protein
MKKYPYTGAIEIAPMAAFMTDFIAGKIEPTLKSQEVTSSPALPLLPSHLPKEAYTVLSILK